MLNRADDSPTFRTLLENWNRSFSTWRVKTQRMSYQHLWQPKVPKKKHPMLNCHLTSVNLVPFKSNLSKCKLLHFRCFNFLVNLPNWIPPTRSPTGWYRRFTAPLRALDDGFLVRHHLVLRRVLGHPSFLPVGFSMGGVTVLFPWVFHGFKRFLKEVPHGKKETRPFFPVSNHGFWGGWEQKTKLDTLKL